jgi:Skp family chaperone for outer membrane proteins
MRKRLPLLILAISLMFFTTWAYGHLATEEDASPAPASSGGYARIAFIDITKIFRGSSRFKELMARLKDSLDDAEMAVENQNSLVAASEERLKKMEKSTDDYRDLEKNIAESKEEIANKKKSGKEFLLNREAEIYSSIYRDIEQEVQTYAEKKKIDVVLRIQNMKLEENTSEDVKQYINRPIIWRNEKYDITDEILERLQNKAEKSE